MQRFLSVASVLLLVSAAGGAEVNRDRPPNIVFVLLDNVGKDWIRSYGSQENVTPNIDRLCRTGMKFRNFYVTPVCSTTRTMLLTGRYPFRTGWHTHHDTAIYGGGFLDWNREVTVARVLRDAGYKTCISGKWQINDLFDPEQVDALAEHGFQEPRNGCSTGASSARSCETSLRPPRSDPDRPVRQLPWLASPASLSCPA